MILKGSITYNSLLLEGILSFKLFSIISTDTKNFPVCEPLTSILSL